MRLLLTGAQHHAATPTVGPGRVRPKAFEGDGLLLVGEPVAGEPDVVPGQVNNRQERWARRADSTWVAATPAPTVPPPPVLPYLVRQAEKRLTELPVFRHRVARYANMKTPAADLDDMYLGESQALEFRLRQLQQADTEHAHTELIGRLQRESDALRLEGRRVRIAHCKASNTPTGGYPDYLAEAAEVSIRRVGGLQSSGTTARTRNWLQEYEIINMQTDLPLWYGHFHYEREQPRFGDFVAAHLKTPAQRLLGTAAPGEPPIWCGELTRQLAAKLFEPLPD